MLEKEKSAVCICLFKIYIRFCSSKQKKAAVLKQENIQDGIKLRKRRAKAIFYFCVKISTSAIIHFFGSKIYVLSGVMQCIIKRLALWAVYS